MSLPVKFLLSKNEKVAGIYSHSSCFLDKYGEMHHHQVHLESGEFFSMTSRYNCSIHEHLNAGENIELEVMGGTIVSLTNESDAILIDSDISQEVNDRIIIGFPIIGVIVLFVLFKRHRVNNANKY